MFPRLNALRERVVSRLAEALAPHEAGATTTTKTPIPAVKSPWKQIESPEAMVHWLNQIPANAYLYLYYDFPNGQWLVAKKPLRLHHQSAKALSQDLGKILVCRFHRNEQDEVSLERPAMSFLNISPMRQGKPVSGKTVKPELGEGPVTCQYSLRNKDTLVIRNVLSASEDDDLAHLDALPPQAVPLSDLAGHAISPNATLEIPLNQLNSNYTQWHWDTKASIVHLRQWAGELRHHWFSR